ncbi:MAG: RNHCP domain-containing protein [Alphaproteobacteria bacterium]|nr:RNHCP domain-containing protein [Alphaproteobacteria bacterium]MCL2889710.1 RNHCP domain-containing protein [Alphaproteobacteria bacterium]
MKKFTRVIENFKCANCGVDVSGTGYTNHCPACLWSRCVDINPGDRASSCGGMMRPISIEQKCGKYIIIHKCEKCGKSRRQHAADNDDMGVIIKLSQDDDFVFGK